ncbi:cobalamin B12-binding domain-containing protein [Geomonas oryzae]|uniref:cobalamin B12-binding domain-containing protein n=1 Tax=Geomonas oryzae TaxID=2364273 RepID=UPI00100BCE57|nr:cobalamin-dependent protein [Geomonas oryzae]
MIVSYPTGHLSDVSARPSADLLELALVNMDRLALQRIYSASGLTPLFFCEQFITPALAGIGEKWDRGELSLSHVYMSGRLCEDFMEQSFRGAPPNRKSEDRVALAVLEDYHLLGKRLVGFVLRGGGVDYLDYGTVTAAELVRRVQEDSVRVLLISALMLPSALKVREVRDKLDRAGVSCRIIVGGAPFRLDPSLCDEVGADFCCAAASQVLPALKRVSGGEP